MASKPRPNQAESTGGPKPGEGGELLAPRPQNGESSREKVSIPSVETPNASAPFERFLTEAGLMTSESFRQFLERLAAGPQPPVAEVIARELVRAGVLTRYQAAAVYQNKTKGLFVGPYLVLDKIGTGGMGMVFKARHRDHGVVVALKLLPPKFAEKREAVQRFLREAETLARLNHPNIVSSFEVSEINGVHYLAMDYAEGLDLKKLVIAKGPLPVSQAIDCLLQTARGLLAAHSQGIIHRDVKPDNLVLDAQGTVRILDLGLARVVPNDPLSGGSEKSLTESGALMGTVDYMSPEQAYDSKKVNARSDVYSLGCTLHYLLTGHPPFESESMMGRLLAHRENEIPSLRAARPGVPKILDSLFRRMMAKEPEKRPQTMAAVIAALELAQDELREQATARETAGPGAAADDPTRSGKYLSPAESKVSTPLDFSDLLTEVASEVHPPQMVLGSRRYRGGFGLPRPLVVGMVVLVIAAVLLVLVAELTRLLRGRPEPPTVPPSARPRSERPA